MKYTAFVLLLCIFFHSSAQKIESVAKYSPSTNLYEKVHILLPENYTAETLIPILSKKYPCFQNTDIRLTVSAEKQSPGGNHIQFQEYFRNIPLYHAGIKANIHRNGYILSLLNHLETPASITKTDFLISQESALTDILQQSNAYQSAIEKVLYPYQNRWIPAYVVTTFAHTFPVSFEWIVDAETGKIIEKTDRAAYHHAILGDTTGKGVVFRPDPLTKAQTTYSAPYNDNSDQNNAVFSAAMDTVLLKNITYNTTNHLFYLEGPHVKIEDIDPFDSIPVTSANGNFYYTRNRAGFEDVMVYYHIDTLQRYIQSLGFNNLYNEPLRADPHGYGNQDNSHFIPNGSSSYIGWGQGGVDDAEDADVITHEYGHALSYSGSTATNSGTERKGLDEGIGDYICSAYSYDINPYRWYDVFTWDGHNEFWAGRLSNSAQTYPVGGGIYAYGTVWASCLMEIRLAIGGIASDKDFYQELYMNVSNMTLPDAAHNFLDADSLLHNGIHTTTIVNYFCARGLFTGAECTVGITPENEAFMNWNLYPNPAKDKQIFVDFPQTDKNTTIEVMDYTGRVVFSCSASPKQFICLPLQPGIYFVRLSTANGGSDWKKLWIE